jgi:hypothetical protein
MKPNIYIFFVNQLLHAFTRKQNGEQVFVAANGSGYIIEFMILQQPRVIRFNKYFYRSLAHTVFV